MDVLWNICNERWIYDEVWIVCVWLYVIEMNLYDWSIVNFYMSMLIGFLIGNFYSFLYDLEFWILLYW